MISGVIERAVAWDGLMSIRMCLKLLIANHTLSRTNFPQTLWPVPPLSCLFYDGIADEERFSICSTCSISSWYIPVLLECHLWKTYGCKGVFRTVSNIKLSFFWKIVNVKDVDYFSKKLHLGILDMVLNMDL